MKSNVGLYKSDLLPSEHIRLCSIWVRLSRGNNLFMFNGISETALAGKNTSPTFFITIFNTTGIEEEVGKVINRDYIEISTGLNQREVESRDLCTTLCNVKERDVPVENVVAYGLLCSKCEISHLSWNYVRKPSPRDVKTGFSHRQSTVLMPPVSSILYDLEEVSSI